ncbi:hypothetical protein Golob_020132 [Gossypium lobatum]|uniref:Protein kinase domain-containing protein n=1 Tax=Gossypium lobatum TaxID=34289 RepID=A0A7J8L9S6_9ROSI|nr:hypothetical protein [Gossypium lobatum]
MIRLDSPGSEHIKCYGNTLFLEKGMSLYNLLLEYARLVYQSMSSEAKDFLMKCFARKASERWSVEMLLSHPFLMVLKPTVYGKYNLLQKQIY